MESRWWLSIMGVALSFMAQGIPSHAMAAGEDDIATDTKQEDETPEWAKKLYGEPPEFKVFKVAGHKFRVPRVYAPGSKEGEGMFQITPHWPTLDPSWGDKPKQPTHREDFDTLQVTVSALSVEQFERQLEGRKLDSDYVRQQGEKFSYKLENIYGLWHIKGKSMYVSYEPVEIWEMKQHLVIRCGSANCYIGYLPMERVGVHIRFSHAILPDWRELLEKVNGLLEQYQEE